MRFTTQKSEIVEALQIGAAVAERRQTIPILANLRMIAKGSMVEITATDLEIQIKINSNVKQVQEEGETTVSARKMSELCRSLPDNENLDFNLKNWESFKKDLKKIVGNTAYNNWLKKLKY